MKENLLWDLGKTHPDMSASIQQTGRVQQQQNFPDIDASAVHPFPMQLEVRHQGLDSLQY